MTLGRATTSASRAGGGADTLTAAPGRWLEVARFKQRLCWS
jgi:hypothetical protein